MTDIVPYYMSVQFRRYVILIVDEVIKTIKSVLKTRTLLRVY